MSQNKFDFAFLIVVDFASSSKEYQRLLSIQSLAKPASSRLHVVRVLRPTSKIHHGLRLAMLSQASGSFLTEMLFTLIRHCSTNHFQRTYYVARARQLTSRNLLQHLQPLEGARIAR
jgi:hypothetical protein